MDSILRVANRAIVAGFIPDKFWKTKAAELKVIFAKSVGSANDVMYLVHDEVLPFYKRFEQELYGFDINQFAEESIKNRFFMLLPIIEGVSTAHENFHKATNKMYLESPRSEVISSMQGKLKDVYNEKFKTFGHAFKAVWRVDANKIEQLADRLLKKAPQDVLDAMWEISKGEYRRLNVKYQWLAKVNAEGLALKLITKEKLDWDPFQAIGRLRDMLEANYSENALDAFSEFDIGGMKIVVDDKSMAPDEIKKYVGYLQEAHARLKTKGFGKVWYGTTFISCKECGGVNYNTGGGVGGHFNIQKDWVKIFSRPSSFIVELMAHELGHRHWFKGMSSGQRARFESLVKTHEGRNPEKARPKLIRPETVANKKAWLLTIIDPLLLDLSKVSDAIDDGRVPSPRDLRYQSMRQHEKALDRLYEIGTFLVDGGDLISSREALSLLTETSSLGLKLQEALFNSLMALEVADGDPAENLANWESETYKIGEKLRKTGLDFLETVARDHNRESLAKSKRDRDEIEEAWKADQRQVLPVSDYGSSNIDEAFAEVFMKYIMGEDLGRDQLESFKTVFGSAPLEPEDA